MEKQPKQMEVTANIGCGTILVLILIVAFFGNRGLGEIREGQERLEGKVDELLESMKELHRELEGIREELRER